ncbi:DUF2849 domain-containing protein [Hyphococcus sp.]|uniref:DUF2849 domain-containing protein n=1 Tax=Hyphococcus sp. TaxID=2038636 RepID=UPI003CCC3072
MKIVTANRLDDGAVVYLSEENIWTVSQSGAAKFAIEQTADALATAQSRVTEIADAYLVSVDPATGALTGRETLRETIRRDGPTIRRDLNSIEPAHV